MKPAPIREVMLRAAAEALRGRSRVEPNPTVGAAVVRDGEIIAVGHHDSYGGPHAEIAALRAAGAAAKGADLYVTLEPCSTTGKTPPCTEAVIAAGIGRLIYAQADPDPRHQGRARAILEAAGIEVVTDFAADCAGLLADFRRFLAYDRPVVVAKWAASLDGRIATRSGESRWITGEEARRVAHEERARAEAVLVGVGTVLADDPRLDARLVAGRAPRPVVLDSALRCPLDSVLVRERSPLVVTAAGRYEPERRLALEAAGAEVVEVPAAHLGRPEIEATLRLLAGRGVRRLMVEGGAEVLGAFFAAGLVDVVQHFSAPMVIGDAEARPAIAGPCLDSLASATRLLPVERRVLGDDLMQSFLVLHPERDGEE